MNQDLPNQNNKTLWRERFIDLFDKVEKHEIFILSGSFAYTTALALAPFLVIMLSFLAFSGTGTQDNLIEQMTTHLGKHAGNAIKIIAQNAQKDEHLSGLSGLLSFIIILVSGSAMFSQMRNSLDKVNEYQESAKTSVALQFFKQKILSIGLLFGFVFLLVASLFITAIFSVSLEEDKTFFWEVLNFTLSFIVFSFLFSAMFRFVPSKPIAWKRSLISGILATTFFLLGKSMLGLYLGKSAIGSAYGALGSLIVLLIWLYYTSFILLFSCEFTNAIILPGKAISDEA